MAPGPVPHCSVGSFSWGSLRPGARMNTGEGEMTLSCPHPLYVNRAAELGTQLSEWRDSGLSLTIVPRAQQVG